MRRHPYPNQLPTRRDRVRDRRTPREKQGQGSRPEGLGQRRHSPRKRPRDLSDLAKLLNRSEMHDQRIPGRSLLGSEDTGDGFRRQRIGPKTINRLGRKGYKASIAKQRRRPVQIGRIREVEMESGRHEADFSS